MSEFGRAKGIDWEHPEAKRTWGRLFVDHIRLIEWAHKNGFSPLVIHNLRKTSIEGIVANMAEIHPIHSRVY